MHLSGFLLPNDLVFDCIIFQILLYSDETSHGIHLPEELENFILFTNMSIFFTSFIMWFPLFILQANKWYNTWEFMVNLKIEKRKMCNSRVTQWPQAEATSISAAERNKIIKWNSIAGVAAHSHVYGWIFQKRTYSCNAHVPLWLRMLGKNFWCPTCSRQFHLNVNLSTCPTPLASLRGYQYPKSSIIVDSNTFRFSKYRGSLCVIQWTEIQIYKVHIIAEGCHIKLMTLIKILKPNARSQPAAKLRNTFFFHCSGQNLIHLERVERMNFLLVKVNKRICVHVILTI